MSCNSNNFQHIEKILRTSVDNSVLPIPLKFKVDGINTVRVLLLGELKNAVLSKTRKKFKVCLPAPHVEMPIGC